MVAFWAGVKSIIFKFKLLCRFWATFVKKMATFYINMWSH